MVMVTWKTEKNATVEKKRSVGVSVYALWVFLLMVLPGFMTLQHVLPRSAQVHAVMPTTVP